MTKNDSFPEKGENLKNILPENYRKVLEDLILRIKTAQLKALSTVNKELIYIYRDIGKTIHNQQEAAQWGSSVVEQLARFTKFIPGNAGILCS